MSEAYPEQSDSNDAPKEIHSPEDISLATLSGQHHDAGRMIMENLGAEPVEATTGKRRRRRRSRADSQPQVGLNDIEQYALINGVSVEEARKNLLPSKEEMRELVRTAGERLSEPPRDRGIKSLARTVCRKVFRLS